jgi:hypothetical protein
MHLVFDRAGLFDEVQDFKFLKDTFENASYCSVHSVNCIFIRTLCSIHAAAGSNDYIYQRTAITAHSEYNAQRIQRTTPWELISTI